MTAPRVGQELAGLFALFSSKTKDVRNFNDLDKNLAARMMPSDYRFEIVQVWFADNGTALQCEVNNNYDDCSMRYDFGPPLARWGFDRVYPVHGVSGGGGGGEVVSSRHSRPFFAVLSIP